MFAVLAITGWSLVIGLSARRFGAVQQGLLLAGIFAAMAVQYTFFGAN